MKLFKTADIEKINKVAEKSKELTEIAKPTKKGLTNDIAEATRKVEEYFKDSPAILITTKDELHEYVTKAVESGYCGIDTETTGLDRIHDHIVGASLYYPGGVECYIPMKHLIPIFDEPYKNQMSYDDVHEELQRFVEGNTKMIFANADFDLAMIYKDLKVDMCDICYYDVQLAWRCLKEDEKDNSLKGLYAKYVARGKIDPMKFKDFFTPAMFPYCKPDVAKLYAANDAKITYDLFIWQLPYVTPSHPKCKKHHLEAIARLIWDVEFPLIKVCQNLHRDGIYIDKDTANVLRKRYAEIEANEKEKLAQMVDEELAKSTNINPLAKNPFVSGKDFNPKSPPHVKYLLYTVMELPNKDGSTDKEVLGEFNLPITNQILYVRSLGVLISTFVEKMPNATTPDNRIHAQFHSVGASTGRFSCIEGSQLISTPYGCVPMQKLSAGDEVYSLDEHGNIIITSVESIWSNGVQNCVMIEYEINEAIHTLICTPDHLVQTTNRGWVHAIDLTENDNIFIIGGDMDA